MASVPSPTQEPETSGRQRALFEVFCIFLVFFIHAGWPVPDVNEAHYLSKAKHYWNPDWCERDFFLSTPDAHQTFVWTVGWLTLLLPLPAVAWVGRLAVWAALAWAWRRMSAAVAPRPFVSVLSAALFVTLLARFHLAGEWVVGGIEAKCIAYVFVLLALEAVAKGRWNRVWLLLGVASAFHVLVGAWSVLAAGFAWLLAGKGRTPLLKMAPALLGGLALSLPGLIPAVMLTWGVEREITAAANRIYVFERLRHHLALLALPADELTVKLLRNGAVLGVYLALTMLVPASDNLRRLRSFITATLLFAVCGFTINFALQSRPELAAAILRYYWFRLYDVALPLGVSIFAVALIASLMDRRRGLAVLLLLAAIALPAWHLGSLLWQRHEMRRDHGFVAAPADRRMGDAADWIDVCRWARKSTPEDAIFLTPRRSHTFKWHAERAEVVTHKDIPQDALGIVHWQERIDDLYPQREILGEWKRRSITRRSDEELRALAEKYGARYVITSPGRVHLLPIEYQNSSFVAYRIDE